MPLPLHKGTNLKVNFQETPHVSMFEVKLISMVDFPERMQPGVFLSCADDIQFFDVDSNYRIFANL